MKKITKEIHKYILDNTNVSNRKLEISILEKFKVKVSYRQIGEYKSKSLTSKNIPKQSSQLPKRQQKTKSSKPKLNPKKLIDITTVIDNMRIHGHKQNLDDIRNIVGSTEITHVRNWLKTEIKSLI